MQYIIRNDSIILATSGFYGDVLQLKRVLQSRLHKYRFDYRADMTVDLGAELLSRNLYYKRFFPYYTGAILAGIDENGKGAVFSYDPIGCLERINYSASGSAEPMIIPFLDCQIGHVTLSEDADRPALTIGRATSLIKVSYSKVTFLILLIFYYFLIQYLIYFRMPSGLLLNEKFLLEIKSILLSQKPGSQFSNCWSLFISTVKIPHSLSVLKPLFVDGSTAVGDLFLLIAFFILIVIINFLLQKVLFQVIITRLMIMLILVPSFTTNIDDNNDSSSESSAETTTLPQESNPSVIDDVVSGRIIRKIVDVVKDKLGGDRKSKVIKHKVYPAENPFQSCYMCPLDGSSFIFSYLYCRAFVWKPRPVSEKFHTLVQSLPLVSTVKRNLLDRIRRRHVSFLQREMLRFHLQRIFLNGREEIVLKNNFDAAEASTITNIPQTPPQTMSVPAYTTSEALPAGSISHKTDEHKKNMKQTKRAVEDAIEAVAARINKTVTEKILVMRNEMDALSAWLSSLRSSASKLAVARLSGGPRINPSVDSVHSGECTNGHNTHLNPYVDGNDGVWSTEQVVYAVVIAQVATVLLVAILQLFYQKIVGRSISDTEISVEIENLVEQKVLEALQRQNLERVGHQNATNASKRKRKRKRAARTKAQS
uniref:Uncharacterized protein n=1 Tax=Heterorhabditis bacteriophora TaxID=37862 RepID=A0A1I7XGH0_HETBA